MSDHPRIHQSKYTQTRLKSSDSLVEQMLVDIGDSLGVETFVEIDNYRKLSWFYGGDFHALLLIDEELYIDCKRHTLSNPQVFELLRETIAANRQPSPAEKTEHALQTNPKLRVLVERHRRR